MSEKGKRQVLLLAILAVLAVVVVYRLAGGGAATGDALAIQADEPRTVLASLRAVPVVPWERLQAEAAGYNPKGRNLFKFGKVKPPAPTAEELEAMRRAKEAEEEARRRRQEEMLRRQQEAQKQMEAQRQQQTRPQTFRPQETGPRIPPPPNPTFKFIGYIGPTQDKIAVLLDGEDFYLTRVGEVVNEQFRIVEIGYEWVQVGYTDPVYEDQTRRIVMGQ